MPLFEIQADIFTSVESESNTLKTRKNVRLYVKRRHLIIYLTLLAITFSGLFCYGVGLRGPQARKVCSTQPNYLKFGIQVDFGNLSQIPNFRVNSIAFSQIMTSSIFEFSRKRPFTPSPVK